MSIQHNKKNQSLKEYPLSTRTNTQIKKVIKNVLIPYLMDIAMSIGKSKNEAKKEVNKIIGNTNEERIKRIRTGAFDKIYRYENIDDYRSKDER